MVQGNKPKNKNSRIGSSSRKETSEVDWDASQTFSQQKGPPDKAEGDRE